MKFLISLLRNIKSQEVPKYLGRWRIEYCDVRITNIVKLANEDHCGACSQYTLDNSHVQNTQSEIKGN